MKKVCMLVTDGFEEIEAIGTFAILRRGGVTVDIYSLLDKDATGRFGLTCTKLLPFSKLDASQYDLLIIPGGAQYKALQASPAVHALIKQFMDAGKTVAAICAGPTILGHDGYLKGRRYTCFTAMNEDFGGTYCEDYTVKDGNIISGKSAAAAIDFAFLVLEDAAGKEVADKTKKEIYYKGN